MVQNLVNKQGGGGGEGRADKEKGNCPEVILLNPFLSPFSLPLPKFEPYLTTYFLSFSLPPSPTHTSCPFHAIIKHEVLPPTTEVPHFNK